MSSVEPTDSRDWLGGDERGVRAAAPQLEDELRESQERLTRIVDSAMDAIVAIDDEERIVVFNPAAERCSGAPLQRRLGHPSNGSFQRISAAPTVRTSYSSAKPASRI